jgi:CBS-domain-containing membrane protein
VSNIQQHKKIFPDSSAAYLVASNSQQWVNVAGARRQAADVMVSNVITVGVDASIGEVAATLLNNHISGAPVVGKRRACRHRAVGMLAHRPRNLEAVPRRCLAPGRFKEFWSD